MPTTPHVFGVVDGVRTDQAEQITNERLNTYADAILELQDGDDAGAPANHAATHAAGGSDPVTLTAAQIPDLPEAVQDVIGAFFVAGAGIGVTYNDVSNTFTITNTAPLDTEAVQDVVAAMVTAGANVSSTYDDATGTLTIAATGDGTGLSTEDVQDIVAALLVQGTNVTLTYNDALGTLTVAAASGGDGNQSANMVKAGPTSGSAAAPGYRALVASDIPDLPASKITSGLGTMAAQNANAVAITGGTLTGITDLAIADGGTGASTAAAARTNLGLSTVAASGAYNDLSGKPSLGGAAALNVGTTAGTVAAGDVVATHHARTDNPHGVTAAQLGLAAVATSGAKADVGLGNVSNDAQLKIANNLNDLSNTATARSNLGLGSAAVLVAATAATGNTAVQRDSNGRMQALTPATNSDVANKGYADALLPWLLNIDVLATPSAMSGFSLRAINAAYQYGAVIVNSAPTVGDYLEWKVPVAAGTWAVDVCAQQDSLRGIAAVKIDGTTVGSFDFYAASTDNNYRASLTGINVAATGLRTVRLEITGKHASSGNFYAALQALQLRRTA